jgi:hypothetical protein
MACRVLVVGLNGLIGQTLNDQNKKLDLIESTTRITFKTHANDAKKIINEAINQGCTKILFLAWASNSDQNYDQQDVHGDWTKVAIELVELSMKKSIDLYLVGSCLDQNPDSMNFYEAAKSKLFKEVKNEIKNKKITWLRPFYVINLDPPRPRILQNLINSHPIPITINSPNTFNDYILAEDVGNAILISLEMDLKGEVDIGTGSLVSNYEIVQLFVLNLNLVQPIFGKSDLITGRIADTSQLLSLGWRPTSTDQFLLPLT